MVKNKRDIGRSPLRKDTLTKRPITKTRPTTATINSTTNTVANIKVFVRVRPGNQKEDGDHLRNVVKVVDNHMLIFDPKENDQAFFFHGVQQRCRDLLKKTNKHLQFVFDRVFDNNINNDDVFKESTHSLISSLMNGYNCSVFAYGATGAGKTYTMIGSTECPGITFLTMAELFKKTEELSGERDFDMGITYLEVYNEQVQDLLNPGPALQLREDGKYGVIVSGIKAHKIQKPEELFDLLHQGNRNRTQHPTDANAESSRSHAVFQVYIQMTVKATAEVRTAKLSMIDLAGSERASATGCTGARFTEGANINKSLLALGNCINSLADGQRHVPYRDSKLTRLLKDSLGGNCQTVMIANISPSSLSYEDTYNTLKYAVRAKKIKSTMKRNVMNVEIHVGQYVKMVEELKKEVALLKRLLNEEKSKPSASNNLQEELTALKKSVNDLQTENENLRKDQALCGEITNTDYAIVVELKDLFAQKRSLLERRYQIEASERGMNTRRKLKEYADSRVSDLRTETPETKDEAHKRLGRIVDRFQRKECALKDELETIANSIKIYDDKIEELLKNNPRLETISKLEGEKLNNLDLQSKLECEQRELEILRDEHQGRGILMEKMSRFLQLCYLSLKGRELVSPSMITEYDALVKDYEGRKNIKWLDNESESGVISSTSLTPSNVIQKTKEEYCDENVSAPSLDGTFVVNSKTSPNKQKHKYCPPKYLAKATPPTKRIAKIGVVSPRTKNSFRQPLASHFLRGRGPNQVKGDDVKSRPPFRS